MRKAFICPTKYVQGEDELLNLGYFIASYGKSALLIAHQDDAARVADKLKATQDKFGVTIVQSPFKGECSRQEIERLRGVGKDNGCDCIVGLGGGKAIDTAKCVAEGDTPLIIVPTIAATDAPTSHSAVVYTPDGAFDDYFYFKRSPSVVMVDTSVIAAAPTRFLVSGMGDALSTYFEARATAASFSNVNAGLPCGARDSSQPDGLKPGQCASAKGTMAAMALATLCYKTLLSDGPKAKAACDCNMVTPALENIIETNILLSGLGFESGGLAAAHAIHDGLTVLAGTHHSFHGEKVAFGTICQLVLENAPDEELYEVIDFCLEVGLPVCLKDIGVDSISDAELMQVAAKSCIEEESIHAMPFPITVEQVAAAIITADKIGREAKYGSDD
ncbi:MAG: glycerol dehydrogenase [Clostridia bacterium]|nr:glycerol dehydrogenase [Clostridia bacterium]